jgi:hypothetical protein
MQCNIFLKAHKLFHGQISVLDNKSSDPLTHTPSILIFI